MKTEAKDLKRAIRLFMDFTALDVSDVGKFPDEFALPESFHSIGKAMHIIYRSDKFDEGIHDYIHHFGPGVEGYVPDHDGIQGPPYLARTETLVFLGNFIELHCQLGVLKSSPSSELFCTPNHGRCLMVIDDRLHVRAMIWGGRLRVRKAGIVG